jgi:phosphoserine phosphatase RsbU/P
MIMGMLIAEDEELDREILVAALRQLGHEPQVTSSGKQAWDAVRQDPTISMVITDWMMPEMDGLELCRRVRSLSTGSYTYIIMVTAKQGKVDLLQAMDAGVDDFVSKPFDAEILAARLRVAERVLGLLREARQLMQLLPACTQCGKIRDTQGNWRSLKEYAASCADGDPKPMICPDCFEYLAEPDEQGWAHRRR